MTSLCVGLVQSSAFCQAARLFALTEDWRPGIEGKLHLSRRGTLNTASFQTEYFSEWSDKFGAQRCERASTICRDWSQVQRQVLIRCHPQHSRCCSWWPTKKGWHKLQLCSLFDSPSHTLHVLSLLCASPFWKDYFLIVVSVWFSMSRCPTVPRHLVLLSFFRRSHLFLHDSGLSWIVLTPTFRTYIT